MFTEFEEESNDNYENTGKYSLITYKNSKLYINLNTGLNIYYTKNFIDYDDTQIIFKILEKRLKYNSPEDSKVLIFGKYIEIPRSQAAYGDAGTFYRFSGNIVYAKDWSEDGVIEMILRKIRHKLEIYTGTKFNFVLINRYENGNQYIGFHSDDEDDLGHEPKIAGISFGAMRPLYFQNKISALTDIKIDLESGSVILMNHPTNKYWKHSIPKTSKKIGTRISLTYRKMICNFVK